MHTVYAQLHFFSTYFFHFLILLLLTHTGYQDISRPEPECGPALGLATSLGTCAGTCGFIRGKTRANGSPTYESPGAYKTHEYGCQFWITRNPYRLPVQPMVSICVLQQQRGGASPTPVTLATVAALAFALTLACRPCPACRPRCLRLIALAHARRPRLC